MKTPEQIDELLTEIKNYWNDNPNCSLMQLIKKMSPKYMYFGDVVDNVTDDSLLCYLKSFNAAKWIMSEEGQKALKEGEENVKEAMKTFENTIDRSDLDKPTI